MRQPEDQQTKRPTVTAWIIEDEPPALRRLTRLLTDARPDLEITFTSDAVAATRRALRELPAPDVVFSDIHLADGLAFSIWEEGRYDGPVIFTTAYDQYGVRAFRVNSVDYLLKPVEPTDLDRALARLEDRSRPALQQDWTQLAGLIRAQQPSYRQRFLAQRGQEWVPVRTGDLRQIYSSDGLTFALTTAGQRLLLDDTLDRIGEELDPARWFRINRAQLVHVDAVRRVQPYFNHRVVLELNPKGELDNVVSRQRTKGFKEWLGS